MPRSNGTVRFVESRLLGLWQPLRRILGGKSRSLPGRPARVLICKSCCMGDAVLSLYALRAFRLAHPEARVDVLVSARVEEVYRQSPDIGQVHALPVTGRRLAAELLRPVFWQSLLKTLRRLRANRYDLLVDLELYRTYGAYLPVLLGIPWSRGFRVEQAPDRGHDEEFPRGRDAPEWLCFYPLLGMPAPPALPEPLFNLPRAPREEGRRRIGIVFGSSFNWPQKKWDPERFAGLIRTLSGEGFRFTLLGTAMEKDEAERIKNSAGAAGMEDTTGTQDFRGLLRVLAGCDLVVGNDTGTMHAAAACGVPTLTLFGPTNPVKWRALGGRALHVAHLPCRPCYYLGYMPDCNHFSCLRGIPVAAVAAQVRLFFDSRGSGWPRMEAAAAMPEPPNG